MRFLGQSIIGKNGRFKLTADGLIAAAHRGGATAVDNYLKHQQRNGWRSNFSGLPPRQAAAFNEIETRLREFANVGRNKPAVAP